jgi:hypothetical protein
VGQERVERVELGPEAALHVIDRVDKAGVHLDLTPADDANAPRDADPRLVVAIDVRAHGQLGLVFARGEERDDLRGVADRIAAPRDRPRDRAGLDAVAVDPHVHLG